MKMKRLIFWTAVFLACCVVGCYDAMAQQVVPTKYWTFNGTNVTTDSIGGSAIGLTAYGGSYTTQTGPIGKSITLPTTGNLVTGGTMVINTGITIEFLFKPGARFNTKQTNFINGGSYSIGFEYPTMRFSTTHTSSTGTTINDDLTITLDGIGRKSYGYYTDGNWHHMVFKFNASTGTKEIWVDGQLPSGFSKNIAAGSFNNTNTTIYISSTVDYARYYGSLDEFALYNTAIPSSLIYKHYLGFLNSQPYSFTNDFTGTIPTALPVTGPLDVTEFAPGHVLGQLSSGISSGVNQLPTTQLSKFPVPRYKQNHTMMRNVNWMDPIYLGGQFQSWASTNLNVAQYSGDICLELGKNFNYYLPVDWNHVNTDPRDTVLVGIANRNTNIPVSMITLRAQLNGNSPDLTSQTKPIQYYLQNSSNQFLDANGNTTSSKIWRPSNPANLYSADGTSVYNKITNNLSTLNRNISLVNENAEVFPHPTSTAMQLDPIVTADKTNLNLDWDTYVARKYAESESQSYRDVLMTHPKLVNAKFTEYAVDGYPLYRFKYSEARKVNSQINGQYYSTGDFYPRWPYNWRNFVSAWHGWQWFVESRHNELIVGDKYFSPFVSAGWDPNEENNIRPAQWLGLLKCLGNFGAEFYYTGFFSLGSPWPDSRNWIWQAAMPAYSQATFSKAEDIYKNSTIMNGDIPANWTAPAGNPGYMFNGGDSRKLINVRKHNTLNKYIITGTVQPHSNMQGNAELESTASITLDGQQVSFKIRRQGSVYVYDKTTTPATFYQLDGWHESTHPWYWSSNFEFEAELFDNNTLPTLKTENSGTDYTNFTTGANSTSTLEYNFVSRTPSTYYLWVRAKSIDGTSGSVNVGLDSQASKIISCISDTNWVWYAYESCTSSKIQYSNTTAGLHTFKISASNNQIFVDKVVLSTDANYSPTPQGPACNGSTATITASGPTTICTGQSVTLTANAGQSYVWSNGATTQSIVVTNSGAYYANVFNNGCSAVSNIIDVVVNTCATCTAPINLTNVTVGATSVVVSWSPVSQAVNGYTIKLKNMVTGVIVFYQVAPNTTTATLAVSPSTKYRWWVRSKCSGATSSYSTFRAFTSLASSNRSVLVGVSLTAEELESMQFEMLNDQTKPDMTSQDFELYPNPAFTEVNVVYKAEINTTSVIEMFDYTGKAVKTYTTKSYAGMNVTTIDLKDVSAGVYAVKLQGGKTVYVKQLIKE